ncbi:tetratricopeptide repeat protein [Nocardia crassostreae]|uniref:tetratricopeptide repeat protein n=1 Tax=Nocardia crassostreae TaxID=53428 RepID=UPI001FDF91B1|nr:tetratricopeptide repeat protein [Nocardia crassostreae]
MQAGAEAMGRGDLGAALRIFEDAARTATGDVRVAAMVNAAVVTDHSGDHAGAAKRFREALGQMPSHAPRMRPGALIGLSQALQHLGDLDAAQDALEQARGLLAAEDAPVDLRFACGVSATAIALHRSQWARAIELASESLDAATLFAPEQAGHPLMNLAAAHFETGRWDLAEDFAGQALAAFEAAGDIDGVAETRQNLALMHTRSGRFDEAEAPLTASQDYFESAGLAYRAGIGWKVMGFIAEHRVDLETAAARYRQALERFEQSGAEIDAADVRTRLATVAFTGGDHPTGEAELAAARQTYAERGLGLHCAQLDFWHAGLLEPLLDSLPALLPQAVDLAVPAALAFDAVRHELPDGAQRENWNRRMADPALRLAFRYAHLAGDARLIADLIETICAGETLDLDRLSIAPSGLPFDTLDLPTPPVTNQAPVPEALQLGTASAAVAASAGLPITLPPRIAVAPDNHIALADWITAAEQRYGRPLRENRVIPA